MRIWVRVTPGASATHVGGAHAGALRVRVTPRAVEGAANTAVIKAVADALGVRKKCVSILKGERARTKILEIAEETASVQQRLMSLLEKG